jgi:hypothetical protein
MSWTSAITDLRTLLSDGPTDRPRFRKLVIGRQDSSNKFFKTFEIRRVTNFATVAPTSKLGVYVNSTKVTVSSDDIELGIFELAAAPTNNDSVEAVYYYQLFLDSELTSFLNNANFWLQSSASFSEIPDGLRVAALKYAQHDAYQKLSLKFADSTSGVFRLEDMPDIKLESAIKTYKDLSDNLLESAKMLRDDFYSRSGKQNQPYFSSIAGRVSRVEPNR